MFQNILLFEIAGTFFFVSITRSYIIAKIRNVLLISISLSQLLLFYKLKKYNITYLDQQHPCKEFDKDNQSIKYDYNRKKDYYL